MGASTSTTSERNFTIPCNIPDERVSDLLCSALEGGTGYWCQIQSYVKPPQIVFRAMAGQIFKHLDYPMNEGGAVILRDIEADEKKDYTLDRAALAKGLEVMAEKYPKHFGDFRSENDDATTGDVFLQCCLFGETIYG